MKIPKCLNIVQNHQNIFMDYIQPKDCTSAWARSFNFWPGSHVSEYKVCVSALHS